MIKPHQLIYTGIGARKAPTYILELMEQIGYVLASRGYLLRSGHATGSDEYFEKGASRYEVETGNITTESWLPWSRFGLNQNKDVHTYTLTQSERLQNCNLLMDTKVYPKIYQRKVSVQSMFSRNVFQITGRNGGLTQFVVYWSPEEDEVIKGGTRIAVYLARHYNIPCYNLNIPEQRQIVLDICGITSNEVW